MEQLLTTEQRKESKREELRESQSGIWERNLSKLSKLSRSQVQKWHFGANFAG